MKTDKKFTIVLSVYNRHTSLLANMINNDSFISKLERLGYTVLHAVGVYNGGCEQSIVVHTNSSHRLNMFKDWAFNDYHQECILVRNNHRKIISLVYPHSVETIGNHFSKASTAPSGAANYTVLNGNEFYKVV